MRSVLAHVIPLASQDREDIGGVKAETIDFTPRELAELVMRNEGLRVTARNIILEAVRYETLPLRSSLRSIG